MPLSQRRPGGRYTLRLSVRELIRELWNPIHYRPSRHGRRLLNGLEALYHARVELPDGSQWVPAVVRLFPNPRDWDSQVIVELALPEESDRGPLIYRPQLRRSGLISDPAYDLWLSLAYYWDRAKMSNGGYRIYATRPKAKRNRHGHLLDRQGTVILGRSGTPVTNWTHSRAVLIGEERHPQADKVSLLSPKMIRQLAFGPDPAGMSKSLKKKRTMTSRRLIQSLEKDGLIVIEEKGPVRRRHWRILEVRSPPDRATP